MPRTDSCSAATRGNRSLLRALLVGALLLPLAAGAADLGEILNGFYARDGNNDSPAKTAGNNIYIKFFEDRWVGMMFIPYPYARGVDDEVVAQVFTRARAQVTSPALLKGRYDLLDEPATIQIERYGYLQDRILFECSALSACTIKIGDGGLELIKPGVINEHIVSYSHVAVR